MQAVVEIIAGRKEEEGLSVGEGLPQETAEEQLKESVQEGPTEEELEEIERQAKQKRLLDLRQAHHDAETAMYTYATDNPAPPDYSCIELSGGEVQGMGNGIRAPMEVEELVLTGSPEFASIDVGHDNFAKTDQGTILYRFPEIANGPRFGTRSGGTVIASAELDDMQQTSDEATDVWCASLCAATEECAFWSRNIDNAVQEPYMKDGNEHGEWKDEEVEVDVILDAGERQPCPPPPIVVPDPVVETVTEAPAPSEPLTDEAQAEIGRAHV